MLKLKDGYYITTDKRNIKLKREIGSKGNVKIVGFYCQLDHALLRYIELMEKKIVSGDKDVEEIVKELKELKEEVIKIGDYLRDMDNTKIVEVLNDDDPSEESIDLESEMGDDASLEDEYDEEEVE